MYPVVFPYFLLAKRLFRNDKAVLCEILQVTGRVAFSSAAILRITELPKSYRWV